MDTIAIHCRTIRLLATFVIVCVSHSAVAGTFTTTGTYDETATNMNNVDFNATFSSGTGGATAANTITASTGNGATYSTVGPFNANLASAFLADMGGTWSFDTQTPAVLPNTNSLTYGLTQSKSISLTLTTVGQDLNVTTGGPVHNSTPISGTNYLDNRQGFGYTFTFGSITNPSPGELGVTQLGFTALSANDGVNTALNFGTVTGTATFSGGGSVSETRTINEMQTLGDTFFGFVAPAGQIITAFSINSSAPGFGSPDLDDIAFITNLPAQGVPDVGSTLFLLFLANLALFGFRDYQRNQNA